MLLAVCWVCCPVEERGHFHRLKSDDKSRPVTMNGALKCSSPCAVRFGWIYFWVVALTSATSTVISAGICEQAAFCRSLIERTPTFSKARGWFVVSLCINRKWLWCVARHYSPRETWRRSKDASVHRQGQLISSWS